MRPMREAREELERDAPARKRKPLVRGHSFSVLTTPEHPEDTRKAALTRAYAEMFDLFDLSDRFNTEET